MSEAIHPGSGEMFDQIAGRYDLLNRLMSMGIDQSWRRKTVTALDLPPDARVLDLATGTGDLALMIARLHPDAEVIGSDCIAPGQYRRSGGNQDLHPLRGDLLR